MDRPHVSGKISQLAAVVTFIGFNFTFFPQFILGVLGMPRRYAAYPPEFQVLNVFSTAGASILVWATCCPSFISPGHSSTARSRATIPAGNRTRVANTIASLTENFIEIPIMDHEAYDYEWLEAQQRKEVASV